MKNIRYLKCFTIVCIWMLLYSPALVAAEEMSGVEFAVKSVIPDNQTDQEHTYFDLKMEASQKQTVEVEIWNLADREIQIETQIHSATTNKNGVIEYGQRDVLPDDTLPYQMAEIVTCDSSVTVPANGMALLELHIQMPEEEYEGILAGGLTFKRVKTEETENADSDTGFAVQNTYSYVIGIVLREGEKEVEPELVLNDVFHDEVDRAPVISVNIQNIRAAYVDDLEMKAWITRKGTTGTLYQALKENMRIAPNSNLNFNIDLKGKSLNEGDFTLYVTANSAEQEWNWEKDFTLDSGTIFSEEAIVYEKTTTGYLWLIAVVAAVLLLSGIIVYRYRRIQKIRKNYKETIIKDIYG